MIPLAAEADCVADLDCLNGNFLCGVVEGFYGRPWTTEQRKKLFKRMSVLGMNTYLYAPKDDCKHRVYWRELYSVEEADHLTNLIAAAAENNVSFVYAISPGLDMTYSSSKDVTCLKRKLEQVSSFGCKSFALLFDDIEIEMCEPDKEIFQSIANAQVSVTNEVYQHLGQPKFLFCPTEYCASRAIPSVICSEYLTTVGSKLLPDVDVMWTGPKVVSHRITIMSIKEIAGVLQRPPVIWDNIHANDYDRKRLFLGPYEGRSTELIPHLKGVLTNPNCEFDANFIAMHTLSQWCKSSVDSVKRDLILSDSVVRADIKLETAGEYSSDDDIPIYSQGCYQPRQALLTAISDWLVDWLMPVVNSRSNFTATTPSTTLVLGNNYPSPIGVNNMNDSSGMDSYMQPSMALNPVNSLVDVSASSDSECESCTGATEPMDCAISPGTSPVTSNMIELASLENTCEKKTGTHEPPFVGCTKPDTADVMQIDIDTNFSANKEPAYSNMAGRMQTDNTEAMRPDSSKTLSSEICSDDLALLVDLFYLPFEHSSRAVDLLLELYWIKTNAHTVVEAKTEVATEHQTAAGAQWHDRAEKFLAKLSHICSTFDRLCCIPNKALLCDLFQYMWDMKAILSVIGTFVQWLALGHVPFISVCYLQGNPNTWFNREYRDHFMSGDQEPWVFQGGLQAEFQRMLPLEGAADLLYSSLLTSLSTKDMCAVRPYQPKDEVAMYEICRKTCDDRLDGTEIFPDHLDLIGDKLIGGFLSISPEYCFILEDKDGLFGYVVAALDSKVFLKKHEVTWLPAMQKKYPKPVKDDLTPAEELICSVHSHKNFFSDQLYTICPSLLRMDILPDRKLDDGAARRALACLVSVLRSNGSHGVYTEVHVGDRTTVEFYSKMGFCDVLLTDTPEDLVILGRNL